MGSKTLATQFSEPIQLSSPLPSACITLYTARDSLRRAHINIGSAFVDSSLASPAEEIDSHCRWMDSWARVVSIKFQPM